MPITVIVNFNVKKALRSDFLTEIARAKRDLASVSGCLGVQVLGKMDDESSFALVETWSDIEVQKRHLEEATAAGAWNSIAATLASPPTSEYYTAS